MKKLLKKSSSFSCLSFFYSSTFYDLIRLRLVIGYLDIFNLKYIAKAICIGDRMILTTICNKCPASKSLDGPRNYPNTPCEYHLWKKRSHLFTVVDCSRKPRNFSIYTGQKFKPDVSGQSPFSLQPFL